MHCAQTIAKDIFWIGADDRRITIFEGIHPVDHGMSYNSYLIMDEKTVLLDTMDRALEERFLASLDALLAGRTLDYVVVNHIEPDHSATLGDVVRLYPGATIVCTKTCSKMVTQFLGKDYSNRIMIVGDGDSLNIGEKTLAFATAPMVHWPEVMVTYDITDKILFSADAFGTFGTLDGKLFDDNLDWEEMLPEMRRYYANIVGKYGTQTAELLAKMGTLDVDLVCPLHGPMLRKHIAQVVEAYGKWAAYEAEDQGVLIAYASIYGGTRDAAEQLAFELSDAGIHDLVLYDLSMTDVSYVLADAFRCSNIVLASVTYNAGVFPKMAEFVRALGEHNLRRRRFSVIQNGSWGPTAGKKILAEVSELPEAQIVGKMITIKSRLAEGQDEEIRQLAADIAQSILRPAAFEEATETTNAVEQTPIAGAARPAAPIPVAPGAFARPLTPPPSAIAGAAPLTPPPGAGAGSSAAPQGKIIQVWRCTFCGYQLELEKGAAIEWADFACPTCMKKGDDLFMLVREKVVS